MYFDANVKRIWSYLLKAQEDDRSQRFLNPLITVTDPSKRLITCYLKNEYNRTKEKHFNLLMSRPHILSAIDTLTSREYEALSVLLCKISEANNYLLTPPGNEAGIDFIATIKFNEDAHYLFGVNGPIRIIGQCKKYASPVQLDKVKEFNATLNDVYHLTHKVKGIIPSWFSQSKGIIVGWIIGHNGFQQGAKDRAKDFGIVLSDSRDIAEIISKSEKYYPTTDYSIRHLQLKNELKKILE